MPWIAFYIGMVVWFLAALLLFGFLQMCSGGDDD